MGSRSFDISLALAGLYVFLILFTKPSGGESYDECNCRGPTKYYEELGCIPMFRNSGSCCPVRYECGHWKTLPADHCFIDGREYRSHEPVGESSSDPCVDYTCRGASGVFNQTTLCGRPERRGYSEHCYEKKTPFECCATVEICSDNDDERPTCVVDGKIYKDGESFRPTGGPPMHCICGEGYTGQNIEPFCRKLKPSHCENVLFRAKKIRANCIPVYDHDKSPQDSCNSGYRCQTVDDVVIPGTPLTESIEPEDPDMMCKFGNLTMRIGDVLGSRVSDGPCMGCICEVPPVATCRTCTPHD